MGIFGPPEKVKRDVEGLIKALKDKNSNVRKKTAAALREALVEIGKPAVKPLIEALKDENFLVQECAAGTLGKIGDAKAVKPLIEVISRTMDSDAQHWIDIREGVRSNAVEALGKIGKPAVIPLMQALKDEDEDVRTAAKQALKKIKAKKS